MPLFANVTSLNQLIAKKNKIKYPLAMCLQMHFLWFPKYKRGLTISNMAWLAKYLQNSDITLLLFWNYLNIKMGEEEIYDGSLRCSVFLHTASLIDRFAQDAALLKSEKRNQNGLCFADIGFDFWSLEPRCH